MVPPIKRSRYSVLERILSMDYSKAVLASIPVEFLDFNIDYRASYLKLIACHFD
jgi:hypothetical protein